MVVLNMSVFELYQYICLRATTTLHLLPMFTLAYVVDMCFSFYLLSNGNVGLLNLLQVETLVPYGMGNVGTLGP